MNLARFITVRGLTRTDSDAAELAERRYPASPVVRAAVTPATTANGGGPIAQDLIAQEAWQVLQGASIFGRLFPLCRRLPFKRTVQRSLVGSTGSAWLAEGEAVSIGVGSFSDSMVLGYRHAKTITVLSKESLDFTPTSEAGIRGALSQAVAGFVDSTLLDPSNSGGADEPASLTSAGVAISTAGTSAANAVTDLDGLLAAITTGGIDLRWVINSITFSRLVLKFASLGYRASVNDLLGIPVLTSSTVPSGLIALIDCPSIACAFDEQIPVDVSTVGTIQMDGSPTMNGAAGTGAAAVSLWQSGMAAISAEVAANWSPFGNLGSPSQASGVSYVQVSY